ncbi:glycosyltransferase [Vibrio sp. 10N.222.55.E8]
MKNIVVNASAAREGGALSILNMYIESKIHSKDECYIVLSPLRPTTLPLNAIWIKKETFGLNTLLFSLFFVWYYCLKYSSSRIVSFSNVNVCFRVQEKVTYFHQALIFTNDEFKFRVYRFVIKYLFQNGSEIITQSPYVRNLYLRRFGLNRNVRVCWPGISDQFMNYTNAKCKMSKIKNVFVPIVDVNNKNKNFSLAYDLISSSFCDDLTFKVTTESLGDRFDLLPNISCLGYLEPEDYLKELSGCDAVLITSVVETVCLPIFEAVSLGKIALVYEQDYIKDIISYHGEPENIFLFRNRSEFLKVIVNFECHEFYFNCNSSLYSSDWSF